MTRFLAVCVLAACTSHAPAGPDPDPDPTREHNPRFHGWWAVEQPFHAAYEVTFYDFRSNGALVLGSADPANCTGHLDPHCVTGTVANCTTPGCTGTVRCVFGSEWFSLDSNHLVIVGDCSDAGARDIVVELNADASTNTEFGGAGGKLISVGGETSWMHDNWDWAFRKCVADPTTCHGIQHVR